MRSVLRVSAGCLGGVLSVVLATSACAQAQQVADEVVRIDAPGVLDKPGATYLLTKDVTAEKTVATGAGRAGADQRGAGAS